MTFQALASRYTAALLLALLIGIAFGFTVEAADITEPTTSMYEMVSELRVTNTGSRSIDYLRVIVPLALQQSTYGIVTQESFSWEPTSITTDEHGQRIGTFYVENLRPGQQFVLVQRYQVTPSRISNQLYSGSVSQAKVAADNELIRSTAEAVTFTLSSDRDKAQALLRFTRDHVRYNGDSSVRNHGALTALQTGEGVCEDFAALFVSLAKAAGLDARVVYGYRSVRNTFERHAWAECWLDNEWVPADPVFSSVLDDLQKEVYIAQWFEERPIKVRHSGGSVQGSLAETVTARTVPMLAVVGTDG